MYRVARFPFLIGRIRTMDMYKFSYTQPWFPFLIGRIRTRFKNNTRNFIKALFPFLIGRIRTNLQHNNLH